MTSNDQEPPQNQILPLINLFTRGRFHDVLSEIDGMQKIFPNSVLLFNISGSVHTELRQFDLAIDNYKKALVIKPDYADAFCNIGIVQKKIGELDESILSYKKAIKFNPLHAVAYYNLGDALKDQGKLEEAIEVYNKALAIKPDYTEAHYNLGNALKDQGKLEEAVEVYNKALAIKPNYAEAYNNLGVVLTDQGKLEEAIEAYNKALSLKPDDADTSNNMGIALKDQGKLEEAIEAYSKALAIKPDYAEAFNNKGAALKDQGKLEEAMEAYSKALAIKPDYANAYYNMGAALQDQGKLEEAMEAYKQAIALKPDYADAYKNMSFLKLQTNSWREGIELRKWRWHTEKHQIYKRSFSAREWDGKESIHNKTLLIWAEQGPGDVIIWASCINHYTKTCGKIIIECHPKLVKLLKSSFPEVLIRSSTNDPVSSSEDFDFHVPMETLFGYACLAGVCTDIQTKYLFPDPQRVKYWSDKLRKFKSRKTVGLSWKSPFMTTQRAKNYPALSYWGEALQKFEFTFINLQSTDYQDDIAYFYDHFRCEIIHMDELDLYNDLSEVAALSQALDCSISVATAAATISAAVGTHTIIPTWAQSPWNNILFSSRGPSVDILQKNTSESWGPVFEEIKTKLSTLDRDC